jgi:hypothetical protein
MSLQKQIYCLKERTYTDNVNPKYVTTENGRLMIKAACASCVNWNLSLLNKEINYG